MSREELLKLHAELTQKAKLLMAKKNADYAHGSDPFANFRGSLFLGVEPEIGALMRTMDKFKRIESFIKSGSLQVEDESVIDSVVDIINYAVLIAGMIKERQENASANTNNNRT